MFLKEIQKLKEKAASQTTNYNFNYSNQILDFTANYKHFNREIFNHFNKLFNTLDINKKISDLYKGEKINITENKAALHHIYRDVFSESKNKFIDDNKKNLAKSSITESINLKNYLIKNKIKNIITLGIGGSFEGPKLLLESLMSEQNLTFNHIFITGPDKEEFFELTKILNPHETFIIASSKSLSTDETLQTIDLCKKWLGDSFKDQSLAVTSNKSKADDLKFNKIILFEETIGGRFSIWSPISLPAIIELGESFLDFLRGAAKADYALSEDNQDYVNFLKHIVFSDIYLHNFLNINTRVVLPYSWKLRSFTNYVQQLEMESIGKAANQNSFFKKTGQIIFGGFGSTAQHSYFQLLHQGTQKVCADIITIKKNKNCNNLLYAQSITQANLLSTLPEDSLEGFEKINSNSSVNLFNIDNLSSFNLGYLIAFWEQRVFVTAMMLEINPFDQYGVSAGKIFTKKYLKS